MSFKSIGSDMEVFAKDKDGHFVSLCGKIGGTKEAPLQVKSLPEGFMVQEDNVSLEFNIPPAVTAARFLQHMTAMREYSRNLIASLGYTMANESSASFDKSQLTHPNAMVFGCEPDYDAWKACENPRPKSKDKTLRTAGGHIHIGTDRDMLEVIRNMDLFLGVPSVILDNSKESIERRQLYGKAGAFRPKPYGVEYRSLSNFWLFDNKLITWVYNQTYRAANFKEDISKDQKDIIECINTGNIDLAKKLVDKYKLVLDMDTSDKEKSLRIEPDWDHIRATLNAGATINVRRPVRFTGEDFHALQNAALVPEMTIVDELL